MSDYKFIYVSAKALVSAELTTGASIKSLEVTMSQLLQCASDKERHVECRTHALNILRALFRHAPLAEHVAPYISEGVIVALSGFRGKTWAVSKLSLFFPVVRAPPQVHMTSLFPGKKFSYSAF